jgi:hypothetical protein
MSSENEHKLIRNKCGETFCRIIQPLYKEEQSTTTRILTSRPTFEIVTSRIRVIQFFFYCAPVASTPGSTALEVPACTTSSSHAYDATDI